MKDLALKALDEAFFEAIKGHFSIMASKGYDDTFKAALGRFAKGLKDLQQAYEAAKAEIEKAFSGK